MFEKVVGFKLPRSYSEQILPQMRIEVERILQMEPKERTSKNLAVMERFFRNNRYMKEQAKRYESKTINYLFK